MSFYTRQFLTKSVLIIFIQIGNIFNLMKI